VRGYIKPKPPKGDFMSNSWRRQRNQFDRLVKEASVNSTKDSLDERGERKKIKNTRKKKMT
jgi:hypothetical protein